MGLLPGGLILIGPRLFWFDPREALHPRQSSPALGTLGWLGTLPWTPGLCSCLPVPCLRLLGSVCLRFPGRGL